MTRTEKLAEAARRVRVAATNPLHRADNGEEYSSLLARTSSPARKSLYAHCVYLGERLSQGCSSLVHRCTKHCTTTTRFTKCSSDERHCPTCPDLTYKLAYPPIPSRHLAYFILPVSTNHVWRKGVDALRRRWHLFTGRKIFAVATGQFVTEQGTRKLLALDSLDTVRAYLPPDAEVIDVPNDPSRWELAAWPKLWAFLPNVHPDDVVLYAHAKGATRPGDSTAHRWADLLYSLSLDYWSHTESLLHSHTLVGPLKRTVKAFGAPNQDSTWHFSGNFWWARVGPLKEKLDRVPIPVDKWATEAWMGIAFSQHEAGTQFTGHSDFYLYRPADLARIETEYRAWLRTHAPDPLPATKRFPRLSVIVPTTGRSTLARTLASITPQLKPDDELIVKPDDSGDWAATPRTAGMRQARGDYLLFMDDDDIYTPHAFEAIRSTIRQHPNRPLMFKMKRGAPFHDVLPTRTDKVHLGQVSTQMFVVPNNPAKLGYWTNRYEGDFDFIRSTLAYYAESDVVWAPEVIAEWRPT